MTPPENAASVSGRSSLKVDRYAPCGENVQWCGDEQPHGAHPWSDVVCPGVANCERLREALRAARLAIADNDLSDALEIIEDALRDA